jgi:hypothetical protein
MEVFDECVLFEHSARDGFKLLLGNHYFSFDLKTEIITKYCIHSVAKIFTASSLPASPPWDLAKTFLKVTLRHCIGLQTIQNIPRSSDMKPSINVRTAFTISYFYGQCV